MSQFQVPENAPEVIYESLKYKYLMRQKQSDSLVGMAPRCRAQKSKLALPPPSHFLDEVILRISIRSSTLYHYCKVSSAD